MSSQGFMEAHNALVRMEQALNDAKNRALRNEGFRDQADKVRGLARDNASMRHSIGLMNTAAQERENEITRLTEELANNEPLIETLRKGHAVLLKEATDLAYERDVAQSGLASYKSAYDRLVKEHAPYRLHGWATGLTNEERETIQALRMNKAVVLPLPDNLTDIINEIDKMVEHAKAVNADPLTNEADFRDTSRAPTTPMVGMDGRDMAGRPGIDPIKAMAEADERYIASRAPPADMETEQDTNKADFRHPRNSRKPAPNPARPRPPAY